LLATGIHRKLSVFVAEFFGEEDTVLVLSSGQPLLLGLHVSLFTLATRASRQAKPAVCF
tara:strand:- start:295 stop:471 length:177 start_codon:yes stop_codon:yes gene_type:complete